jgi:hypothetical protein
LEIAYLGNFTAAWCTENHIASSFRIAGHSVTQIQEGQPVSAIPVQVANHDLFVWTQTYSLAEQGGTNDARRSMLDTIRDLGIPSVGIHLDKWFGLARAHQVSTEAFFRQDHVFTADGGHQADFAALGINHHWLPPAVFAPEAIRGTPRRTFSSPIAFVGSWRGHYHPEATHRHELITWLRRSFGPSMVSFWPKREQVRGAALSDLYASVKVVVGDSCMVEGTKNYFCVDENTEILTTRGWLTLDEVKEGDLAYQRDSSGLGRWGAVKAVNIYPSPGRLTLLDGPAHSSLTTSNHRWIVRSTTTQVVGEEERGCWLCSHQAPNQRGLGIHLHHAHGIPGRGGRVKRASTVWRWRTTEELQGGDAIPLSSPCADLPSQAKWDDAFVELVAWAWTEGSWIANINRYSGITQSHKVNAPYVDRIRRALTAFAGPASPRDGRIRFMTRPAWTEGKTRDDITGFGLNAALGRALAEIAPNHRPSPSFISELTEAQLRLFVETSIDADGCRSGEAVSLAQRVSDRLDAFEMACALLGIATNKISLFAKGTMYSVKLKKRGFASPLRADSTVRVESVLYPGRVWCPTTDTGTWLARRRGTVYFTGNSDRIPETLGRGGFLLHPYIEGISSHYTDTEHLRLWAPGDWATLRELIHHYLGAEDERAKIASAGHQHVLAHHTYTHRVKEVIATVFGSEAEKTNVEEKTDA